jgi:hypothetical protein
MGDRGRDLPDGVEQRHVAPMARHHALPVGLVVLSLAMAAGLVGLAGREETLRAVAAGVRLDWHGPAVIRSGEFLEMRITVDTRDRIDRPVLEVAATLWEDFTINTLIPAPVEEGSLDGAFRFEFAEMPAGSRLLIKVDAQINPDILGGNAGMVTLYDGEQALVSLPVEIEVLP